jgi:DNA-binding HxlR family transcriptional regulator
MSSSVLYQRLDELSGAKLVRQDEDGRYELTDIGAKLGKALHPLDRWATEWAEGLHR